MAIGQMKDLKVCGIVCAVPDNRVETASASNYDKFSKETVDKVIESTGVNSTYRVLPKQTVSDLCVVAAEKIMGELGWEKDSVDVLVFVSHAPDYLKPATACVIQGRLGLSRECMAFDVALGCSGFVYGMSIIGAIMQNPTIKRGLLLVGDMSSVANNPNTTNNMLFGDCGAAIALERDTAAQTMRYFLRTDGTRYEAIIAIGGGYRHKDADRYSIMNGNDVFSFAITDVVKAINAFMKDNDINPDDVDIWALHQANILILKTIAKKCKMDQEKLPIVIDRYGNTAGSSIPLALADRLIHSERKDHIKVIACGYGIGLSWGVMDLVLDKDVVADIMLTDDYLNDGHYEE